MRRPDTGPVCFIDPTAISHLVVGFAQCRRPLLKITSSPSPRLFVGLSVHLPLCRCRRPQYGGSDLGGIVLAGVAGRGDKPIISVIQSDVVDKRSRREGVVRAVGKSDDFEIARIVRSMHIWRTSSSASAAAVSSSTVTGSCYCIIRPLRVHSACIARRTCRMPNGRRRQLLIF